MTSRSVILSIVLALLAFPAFAGDDVIRSGVDVWVTSPGGTTFAYFLNDPIPADFFCPGSRPYYGRIPLKGKPLATEPEEAFGKADTLIQRLDDAVFDEDGVARTRIQFKALSLASMHPLKNQCGSFDVTVTLDGEQPISSDMTIVRQREGTGYFVAEFELNLKLTFTPIDGWLKKRLVLHRTEPMRGVHSWAHKAGEEGFEYKGFALVDTDGDGEPDTSLPGTSNFVVGWGLSADGKPIRLKAASAGPETVHE